MSMAIPRGGRPLVMAKRMPASRRLCTAAIARSVRTFSCVTRVPSTSASIKRTGGGVIAACRICVAYQFSSGRYQR